MRGLFLLEDLFYKRIDNFWDVTDVAWGKQKFFVMVMGYHRILEAVVRIKYPVGDTAKVKFIAGIDIDKFTDCDIDSIFEDITRLVHHYGGPAYKKIICLAKFCRKTLDYGWYVDQVVKEGDLR